MAAPHHTSTVSQETLITIKISVNDSLKKLKLPLRDLGPSVLPDKLRRVLDIKPEQLVILERYSDSAGRYIVLDQNNPQVFKTLIRAAKAKLKLRLKATVTPSHGPEKAEAKFTVQEETSATEMVETVPAVPRESTAVDQRSIGSGIFQFKEALESQQTLVNKDEAPLPRPFSTDRTNFFHKLAAPAACELPVQSSLAFRPREPVAVTNPHPHSWSVYCNHCDKAMSNAHYHCSVCDGGDYDLCQECVSSGVLCPGEDHWLIKRTLQDGNITQSTTERISPKKAESVATFVKSETVAEKEMPGTFKDEIKTLTNEVIMPTRTCNSCVVVLPEREFVTCTTCEDFDLCIKCHTVDKHGHHPAHGFQAVADDTKLPFAAKWKLGPGRNVRHNAICDGCDKIIFGVRHKCLNCPDWDYCGECFTGADRTHPRHRFAPLYQPIADQSQSTIRHLGIFCDGPLCKTKADQSYIQGIRYKCTICHDTDFCAPCEALPANHHNRTHPLIKLKTPVRTVNVSTENEDASGNVRMMGDRHSSPSAAAKVAETIPVQHANAATQVQTVAEFTPTEVKKEETKPIPIPVKKNVEQKPSDADSFTLLNAHFVRDTVRDGLVVEPEQLFTQVWTMVNPGPYVWPAGCSVRYIGGDNMLNVDNNHPASVTAIAEATESNVVGREVQVGEEVAFKIALKAPIREGKSISYWRLKAADGTPFGHRLWCDVEVKKAEPVSIQEPTPSNLSEAHAAPDPLFSLPPHEHRQLGELQRQQLDELQQQRQIAFQHQHQNAMQRMRIQQMQAARQMAQQRHMERMANVQQVAPQMPFAAPRMGSTGSVPNELPPAYDSTNLSARLATMREQQKQRREQMIAQMHAQRDQMQNSKNEDNSTSRPTMGAFIGNKPGEGKDHQEVLKQRVAHIKANILKTREEREKLAEELHSKHKAAAQAALRIQETEKVQKIVAEVAKQYAQENEVEHELERSQMVFPKLDKESPASSTYESATSSSSKGKGKAAYVENEAGEVERSASPAAAHVLGPTSPIGEDFVDLDDELELLSAHEESDDDGFLTDEEYDILDASDQETIASP